MQYRKEIDGLRALAVVPVIFYHAGFSWFSGGYVGVDVFFVISGYLITSILVQEMEAGSFTLVGFYERRARRILPALIFVMFCTLPFAWRWMSPLQLKEFSQSLVATTFFSSNFLFWNEVGYFAASAAEKPLLHTWSLAIEEQFYLGFPLLLSALMLSGRKRAFIILSLVACASLGISMWAHSPDSEANFYLIHARAWELLAGSLLVFVESRGPLWQKLGKYPSEAVSCFGFALLVFSIVYYNGQTFNSGNYILLPVAGTWLILAFAAPATVVGRVLSQKLMVSTGLVSYSAYLWHQPLFAFARLRDFDMPSHFVFGFLSAITAILAVLSWKYVESPFRNRTRFSRRDVFAFAFVASVSISATGLAGGFSKIGYGRFSQREIAAFEPAHSTEDACDWKAPLPAFPKIETCHIGAPGSERPVVLWGDSHADALLGAAHQALNARSLPGLRVRNANCQPIVGIYSSGKLTPEKIDKCLKSQEALFAYLAALKPRATIIAIRWTFRLFPIQGRIDELSYDNGEGGVEEETYRAYAALTPSGELLFDADSKARAVSEFIKSFKKLGAPVVIQFPVPEVGWNVPNLNFKNLVSKGMIPEIISTSAERFEKRNAFAIGILDAILDSPGVLAVKPGDLFCNSFVAGRCVAQLNQEPFYFDDDHMSRKGADLIVAKILEQLK
jgi:peptidoglycan/LPS O-acetylase OafA/YrhL